MIRLLVFSALFAAVADATCANSCSGHGTCGEEDLCKCFPRWTSPDCSTRECPYGPSWVAQQSTAKASIGPATGVLGGRHGYTVCSSKGECNQDSGECECYSGYTGLACSRQTCPDDCSGHGRCVTNKQTDASYTYDNSFVSEFWDADMTRLCSCDRGWQGYACNKRICPVGADPLTCAKDKNAPTVQRITLKNMDFPFSKTASTRGGFKVAITLTFEDMFNGVYTTQPIRMKGRSRGLADQAADPLSGTNYNLRPCDAASHGDCSQSGAWTALNQYDNTDGEPFLAGGTTPLEDYDANRIRYALESLPNFAIPSVNVTDVYPLDGDNTLVADLRYGSRWYFDVTFSHAANAGAQNLMGCTISSPATDNAASSPRMGSPTIWEHTQSAASCFSCGSQSAQGFCADAAGTANNAGHNTMLTCEAATDCGASSDQQCVWTPTGMYRVDKLTGSWGVCSAATNEGECDGYCNWIGDPTEANYGGYCFPAPKSCLRDDGYGNYVCDGAMPSIATYATLNNAKGQACTGLVKAECTGACLWDGGSCIDSTTCDDLAAVPLTGLSGCPTATGDLNQGIALFATRESVFSGNKANFLDTSTEKCTGGDAAHNLCAGASTLSTCNGGCEWNAGLNTCDNAAGVGTGADSNGAACSSMTTEVSCDGGCTWRRASVSVQSAVNVDMWWGMAATFNANSELKLDTPIVNDYACSAATSSGACDGGCYSPSDLGTCAGGGGTECTSLLIGPEDTCVSTVDDASNNCAWTSITCIERTSVNSDGTVGANCGTASTTDTKATCNGGCTWKWDSSTPVCVSATVLMHSAPTCSVTAVATLNPATKHVCSNRGVCDASTGVCGCFEGYAGDDCALQSIYF